MSNYTHQKYGKRIRISFRITALAMEPLQQAAQLFNMKTTEYAKCVLYRDLGLFTEPVDRRRRKSAKKHRGVLVWERQEEPEE